jgi:protein-S-isoprenylcysteine O-methyltransferase Ste14
MFDETTTRMVFAVVFYSVFLFGAYHRHSAHKQNDRFERMKHEGPATFMVLRIIGMVLWLTYFLFPVVPGLFEPVRFQTGIVLQLTGLFLAVTAIPMGVSVFRNLGRNITDTVQTRANHQLVTTGIYRYIRHPLYTTGFFLFFGLGLLSGIWPALILSVVVMVTLHLRTFEEERRLIAEFGERYQQYIRTTGKFFPTHFSSTGRNHP